MHTVNGHVFESNEKYLKKLDYDLQGKSFHLVMDNGKEYVYSFLTGEILAWAAYGEPFIWENYGCLKLDDETFFVSYVRKGLPERTCITFVLDLENSLVTMLTTRQNVIPERKRLAFVDIVFGAIKKDGEDLPVARHHYTADLVGKQITWTYANGFINTHIYTGPMEYRIRILGTPEQGLTGGDAWTHDEPVRYIKIKENVYLLSFIEENLNKMDPLKGGNNLILLINVKTMHDVGRSFTYNSNQQEEWGLYRAYGEVTEEEIPTALVKSPFKV